MNVQDPIVVNPVHTYQQTVQVVWYIEIPMIRVRDKNKFESSISIDNLNR
jgi:hypothetical protein